MNNTKGLLQRLLESEIEFVLVGGLAATLYGASTVTYDVDVCFDFSASNVRKFLTAFGDLRPRTRAQMGWMALDELPLEQICALKNLYLQTELGGLDLLGSIAGVGDYTDVRRHSREITVFGRQCRIIGLETLIRIKEELGRPKDQQVALELKVILEKQKSTN